MTLTIAPPSMPSISATSLRYTHRWPWRIRCAPRVVILISDTGFQLITSYVSRLDHLMISAYKFLQRPTISGFKLPPVKSERMAAPAEVTYISSHPESATTLRTIVELVRRIMKADVASILGFSLIDQSVTWKAASGF